MAGLTKRSTGATRRAAQAEDGAKATDHSQDGTDTPRSASPPILSNNSSSSDLETMAKQDVPKVAASKGKSLKERSQIPYSFFVTFGTILGLEYCSGMWRVETLERWYSSLKESALTAGELMSYTRNLAKNAVSSDASDTVEWAEYARTATVALFCLFLFFVFVVAPARAGFWTGRRARRHLIHRYMGISYLLHYALAWVEFFTNYEASRTSYLVHIIAVNGE